MTNPLNPKWVCPSVIQERLRQLQKAAVEMTRGFERAVDAEDKTQLAESLRDASAALIEMRRETDDLANRVRFHR